MPPLVDRFSADVEPLSRLLCLFVVPSHPTAPLRPLRHCYFRDVSNYARIFSVTIPPPSAQLLLFLGR